ncbi:MAG: hypothetical protein JWN27_1275 [Candidatus Eremiobacteraeota bacterium]|nr:hypothetical protein [Candidatus Eremiobacteraeota bacterium]
MRRMKTSLPRCLAELRARGPSRERQPSDMRNTRLPDALPEAIAIAHAARRRQSRRETVCGIAPIVALAIGVAICVATIGVLAAGTAAVPLWCTAFGDCPPPF